MDFSKITNSMRAGKPIILLDDPKREGEADIVIHASKCTPEMVRLLRKDAGGMICLATSGEVADELGIDFMSKRMAEAGLDTYRKIAVKKAAYGDEPSFSIYISSRKAYTGITDNDRSLAMREFEKVASANIGEKKEMFVKNFCAPGHVPLLISRSIEKRRGHTEMSVELCKKAGLSPAVVICEMLGDDGKALSWNGAKEYAKKNGFLALEGKEI